MLSLLSCSFRQAGGITETAMTRLRLRHKISLQISQVTQKGTQLFEHFILLVFLQYFYSLQQSSSSSFRFSLKSHTLRSSLSEDSSCHLLVFTRVGTVTEFVGGPGMCIAADLVIVFGASLGINCSCIVPPLCSKQLQHQLSQRSNSIRPAVTQKTIAGQA